jgi:hypothetical protein
MLVAVGTVFVLAALWVWAVFAKAEVAEGIWWAPFLVAVLSHQMKQRIVRRELRRALELRPPQDR